MTGDRLSNRCSASAPARVRRRLLVRGRVQGVGFRPFVYRLAVQMSLAGCVGNDTHGAFIEIEGSPVDVDRFIDRLQAEMPPLARIATLEAEPQPVRGQDDFHIDRSQAAGVQDAEITPDMATCADCLRELANPSDRRYRYPFINCTNCGPRYTIIQAVPYDRPNTTMARFTMCPACQAEYDDPADRRFHAQPNACAACGPRLWLSDRAGHEQGGDPIVEAARLLREGRIVAVKGIGGFHLACRADLDVTVAALRERKGREAKPLAVMVDSLATAQAIAVVSEPAAEILNRPERPIVLLPSRPEAAISPHVAPDLDQFGIVLPYAPVHTLLFAEGLGPLVMTSGNPSEEPLCRANDEALRRLSHIADAFLLHDRPIARGMDDSVVMAVDVPRPALLPVRRARGYAPAPLTLRHRADRPILAVGGELKSTVCLLDGSQALLSEHLGELSNATAYRHFVWTVEQFKKLFQFEPAAVACDLHPDYASTRYAQALGLPVTPVQHHHAHVVSCMAEHNLTGRVVGITCDGTGYGTDAAIWGGEVLVADETTFERAAHLRYYPLLGGDAGARHTWRPAAGLLHGYQGKPFTEWAPEAFARPGDEQVLMALRKFAGPARPVRTSSLGRVFDAVAFLLGVCDENRYEAEAAMRLEAAAHRAPSAGPLPVEIPAGQGDNDPTQIDMRPVLVALIDQQRAGRPVAQLARAFHETVATMMAEAAIEAGRRAGLGRVVLSGGCFLNRLLAGGVEARLRQAGFEVHVHRRVPPGDGGVSLGQAVAAACR